MHFILCQEGRRGTRTICIDGVFHRSRCMLRPVFCTCTHTHTHTYCHSIILYLSSSPSNVYVHYFASARALSDRFINQISQRWSSSLCNSRCLISIEFITTHTQTHFFCRSINCIIRLSTRNPCQSEQRKANADSHHNGYPQY